MIAGRYIGLLLIGILLLVLTVWLVNRLLARNITRRSDVFAIRYGRWKTVFIEQNHEGLDVWREGFNKLRMGKLFDMYADSFERGDKSLMYDQWFIHHAYMMYGGTALVAQWLESFKEFPPRQKPASFNLDEVMSKIQETGKGSN